MSTQAGWYPDPGGQRGKFRYWDGRGWTVALSSDPTAPPPGPPGPPPPPPPAPPPAPPGAPLPPAGGPYGSGTYGPTPPPMQAPSRRAAIGWWLAAGAVLVALVLLVTWAIRAGTALSTSGAGRGGQPTTQVCPPDQLDSPTPMPAQPADGRVHGGRLSYPKLGAPFGPVIPEDRVPFARNAVQQLYVVEPEFDGTSDWVAQVMIGDLLAGDGFFSPEDGSRIVVECVVDRFYGDSPVTRNDIRNAATTIDGHPAWVVESKLSFDVPGLKTKGERLLVAIISTGPSSSGIFYASIPDTTPQLLEPARQALAGLKVSG